MKKIIYRSRVIIGKIRKSRLSKRLIRANELMFIFILFVGIFSYLTNPFTKFNVIKEPFKIDHLEDGQLTIVPVEKIYLVENPFIRELSFLKSAWHILANRMSGGGKATTSDTLEAIIHDIHRLRFNPAQPYLISGDHFSVLYPRSLGIFYHTLLDPRTPFSDIDWLNRQQIYLTTTLYTIVAYQNAKSLSTTISPTGPESVTLNNFFDPPSDTMYSILYALRTLQTSEDLLSHYPFILDKPQLHLKTIKATQNIIAEYKDVLKRHYYTYLEQVEDKKTGLVRSDKSFSSIKDSVIRYGSFYDNVVLWKTKQLAQQLGIVPVNHQELKVLKEKIIANFWLPDEGYFLEDLSNKSKHEKHYSSDWLIVLMTGFLSPLEPTELEYFTKSVEFIRKEKLNVPFGLKYQPVYQRSSLHLFLRLFAPSYATHAIWSHWGMEYIKLLTLLYQGTCENAYLEEAKQQTETYKNKITFYRGYPEVYNAQGNVFKNPFYKSVFQTGWVVNFELASMMTEQTEKNKKMYCY